MVAGQGMESSSSSQVYLHVPYTALYQEISLVSVGQRVMELVSLSGESLVLLIQLAFLPAIAGAIASLVVLKGRLGRVHLQRMLINDGRSGRPRWKLVAKSIGKPISRCRLRVGGKDLRWEGVEDFELDIGADGMGIALIPFEVHHDTAVSAKSGSFSVFRGKFGSLEEVYAST